MKPDLLTPLTPLTDNLIVDGYMSGVGGNTPIVALTDKQAKLWWTMHRDMAIRLQGLLGSTKSCALGGKDGAFFYGPAAFEVSGVVYKIPDVAALRESLSKAIAATVSLDTRFTLLAKQVVEVDFLLDLPASKAMVSNGPLDEVCFTIDDRDDDLAVCVKDEELPLLVEALQAYMRVKKIAP